MPNPGRRTFLGGFALAATTAAGFVGVGAITGRTDDVDAITVDDWTIETVDATCGEPGVDEVTVDRTGATVAITGRRSAPNPCHEAVIEAATVEGDALMVSVGVEAPDDDELCVQCVGELQYEATIELPDAAAVESVTVDHVAGP